jgi:hypothetical protein
MHQTEALRRLQIVTPSKPRHREADEAVIRGSILRTL